MDVKVGTFNVLNLAREGERYYPDERPYSAPEYAEKATWIAGQLTSMKAHVVGFQEVFHEEALRDVCDRSGQFIDGSVAAPGAHGASGPRLGLATRLPLDEPVTSITDFPAGMDVAVDGLALPVGTFSRPILRTRVLLDPAKGTTAVIFVAQLMYKSRIISSQSR